MFIAMTEVQARHALDFCERGLGLPITDDSVRERLRALAAAQRTGLKRKWRFTMRQTIGLLVLLVIVATILSSIASALGAVIWIARLVLLVVKGFQAQLYGTAAFTRKKFDLPSSFGRKHVAEDVADCVQASGRTAPPKLS
jgi:hypothetical protein